MSAARAPAFPTRPFFAHGLAGLFSCALRHLIGFDAAILMYHRFRVDAAPGYVISRREFADQMMFLRRHYDIVPLAAALERKNQRSAVAITIDDGYRSFAEIAFPVLAELHLPVTVFLPVRFIDEGGWLWQDRNIFILRECPPEQRTFHWQGAGIEIDTRGRPALFATMRRIYAACATLPESAQEVFSRELGKVLGVELPVTPPAEFAPMSWSQIRELQAAGVVFGSHTTSHRILTSCDREIARREIAESRQMLAVRLGRAVDDFAYPNGDFDGFARQVVVASGYATALTTTPGFWRHGDDRFTARRIPAPAGGGEALAAQLVRYWWRHRHAGRTQLASTSP